MTNCVRVTKGSNWGQVIMLANRQEILTQTSEKDSLEMVKFKQRPKGLEELSYVYVAATGVEWGWESFIWRNTCEGRLEERAWCIERAHRRPEWLNREGRGKVVEQGQVVSGSTLHSQSISSFK